MCTDFFPKLRFPFLGPSNSWIRFSRWRPIYVERSTRQTMIVSTTKGTNCLTAKKSILDWFWFIVYILPALINHYDKLFSVAELLAYKYATLLSDGASMSPNFNPAYYANPGSCLYIDSFSIIQFLMIIYSFSSFWSWYTKIQSSNR